MARPIKEGLEYFPLDINLDDKIYMVECELGLTGFALLIKLFIKIYSNGYYINWNEKIEKMFARQNNIEVNIINKLINVCINEEILNKDLYEKYNILTSRGIQKRYIEAVKRRKEINLIKDYMLVETMNKLVNVHINWKNVNNKSINDDISTQSKVENSKVENSKEEESINSNKIRFNYKTKKWENITEEDRKDWLKINPNCDIEIELECMRQWLLDNKKKKIKQYRRFIMHWVKGARNNNKSKMTMEEALKKMEINENE